MVLICLLLVNRFSGITKEMLEPVKTTLEDVQREIRRILPADAILCGQSLNGDLMALKVCTGGQYLIVVIRDM